MEKQGDEEKVVLSDLYRKASPGELLVIMGSSGAGKSTLLDVLAGRLDAKGLKRSIYVNGALVNKKNFRKESGYVMQSDALFPLLTVRETIRFAAHMRVPDETTEEKLRLLRIRSSGEKRLFIVRLISLTFFSVVCGTLFLHPANTDQGIQDKASYFILTLAFFYWNNLSVMPIFYYEREIYRREYSSGTYRALSYALSNTIVYIPFLFTLSFVYTMVSWWLLYLPRIPKLFLFQVLVLFIVMMAGTSFATMISLIASNPISAQSIGTAILSVMFMFSGYFVKRSDIPDYWICFHYTSLFKYAIDSELVNGLKDHAYTPDKDNNQVLDTYSVQGINKWTGVGILIAWTLLFRVIFYYRLTTAFNGSRK